MAECDVATGSLIYGDPAGRSGSCRNEARYELTLDPKHHAGYSFVACAECTAKARVKTSLISIRSLSPSSVVVP